MTTPARVDGAGIVPKKPCAACNARGMVEVKNDRGHVISHKVCETCAGYGHVLQEDQIGNNQDR